MVKLEFSPPLVDVVVVSGFCFQVAELVQGRILVGHALENDLRVRIEHKEETKKRKLIYFLFLV